MLANEKIYYQRQNTTYSLNTYTSYINVGSDYLALVVNGNTRYINLVNPGDARASYVRIYKGGTTYALDTSSPELGTLLWSSSTPGTYSYTIPANGYKRIMIYAAGAGGGGGGSDSDDSAGAGGGGASILIERNIDSQFTIPITIGSGGTPGVGTSILWAGTGGSTTIDGFTLGGGTGSIRGGVTGWKTNSGYGGTVSGSNTNYSILGSWAGGRGGQASQTGGSAEGGGSGGTLNAQAGSNGYNGGGAPVNSYTRTMPVTGTQITSIGGAGGADSYNGTTGTLGGGGGGAGENTRSGGYGGPGFCYIFGIY